MAAYVITSWRASNEPDGQGNYVSLTGRREGIISWLLSILRINPMVSIIVDATRIEFSQVSLSGSLRRVIPLPGVCSTIYGYYKPWKQALGIFVFLVWLITQIAIEASSAAPASGFVAMGFLFGLLVGIVCAVIYYFLNRTLTLGFVENSGAVSIIRFKRSVVENQDIDETQAGYVCQLVQSLVDARMHAVLHS
jgi:hypothetical protein